MFYPGKIYYYRNQIPRPGQIKNRGRLIKWDLLKNSRTCWRPT
ncbi:hypothetical protein DCCM_3890 [Desulfocucumis palustris]|uniref:Uncharacterized protein n=1 Tax=Desulfocucumis palustris TaxID=1898651 RepID=A0A2L2XF39_9FIRM|nr:hypothetical protein DCCM_3890 [Desulfocucumis palustris]